MFVVWCEMEQLEVAEELYLRKGEESIYMLERSSRAEGQRVAPETSNRSVG